MVQGSLVISDAFDSVNGAELLRSPQEIDRDPGLILMHKLHKGFFPRLLVDFFGLGLLVLGGVGRGGGGRSRSSTPRNNHGAPYRFPV